MKKTLSTLILLLALSMMASAQLPTPAKSYNREGKTFVQSDAGLMKGDTPTAYTWRDTKGNEYPIILHHYTKGEKAGRTTAYVVRTSQKTGKEYRYFLPDGETIAAEILSETK